MEEGPPSVVLKELPQEAIKAWRERILEQCDRGADQYSQRYPGRLRRASGPPTNSQGLRVDPVTENACNEHLFSHEMTIRRPLEPGNMQNKPSMGYDATMLPLIVEHRPCL